MAETEAAAAILGKAERLIKSLAEQRQQQRQREVRARLHAYLPLCLVACFAANLSICICCWSLVTACSTYVRALLSLHAR
jgi:hypothetical protein